MDANIMTVKQVLELLHNVYTTSNGIRCLSQREIEQIIAAIEQQKKIMAKFRENIECLVKAAKEVDAIDQSTELLKLSIATAQKTLASTASIADECEGCNRITELEAGAAAMREALRKAYEKGLVVGAYDYDSIIEIKQALSTTAGHDLLERLVRAERVAKAAYAKEQIEQQIEGGVIPFENAREHLSPIEDELYAALSAYKEAR